MIVSWQQGQAIHSLWTAKSFSFGLSSSTVMSSPSATKSSAANMSSVRLRNVKAKRLTVFT
jgi:hypothetical protein